MEVTMKITSTGHQASILYIPHGGGPLPLLHDKHHQELVNFLRSITPNLGKPDAILVISAHWEESSATITSGANPPIIYDYYGFPDEAYQITYPAPGEPALAKKVFSLLQEHGINAKMDEQRGFDHGVFVPLKIMYPDASIPCIQLSLLHSLDPVEHLKIGRALQDLRKENILILGSGFSFHNLSAFFNQHDQDGVDTQNEQFQQWLIETCTSQDLTQAEREERLTRWEEAPFARYCHPREEHLLPLHVCTALAGSPGNLVFEGRIIGKKAVSFLWQNFK